MAYKDSIAVPSDVAATPSLGNSASVQSIPGITLRNGFRYRTGQEEFLRKLASALRAGERNILGVFVPGYGKTITALSSFVVAHHLGIAKKLVIFVPRGNLRDQYADAKELGRVFAQISAPNFSYCVADSERAFLKNIHTDIVITTYQYAAGKGGHKALHTYCAGAPCLFVFDEVHHLSEDGLWAQKISEFPHVCTVSLSGTPLRSDNKTLFGVPFEVHEDGNQYYRALHEVSLRSAHSEGRILKRVQVSAIDYGIKLQNTITGETVEISLSQMADMAESNTEIDAYLARKKMRFHTVYLASMLEPAFKRFDEKRLVHRMQKSTEPRNHQMLIIAMSNYHSSAILAFIRERFPQYRSARIGQDIPLEERRHLLDEYRNGALDVMVQVDMIGEGTDIKPISVIVKADLVRAHSKTLQQIFRGMRYYSGFREEDNVCDMYVAYDSGVVQLLEWMSHEEQLGMKIKEKRELQERALRSADASQPLWELADVRHRQTDEHHLELFPGMTRPDAPSLPQRAGDLLNMPEALNISKVEQELRSACNDLAQDLVRTMRIMGKQVNLNTLHLESKKRFAKPQEAMTIAELKRKKEWLLACVKARRIV